MAVMGAYCKAFLLGQMRAFPGWRLAEEAAKERAAGAAGARGHVIDVSAWDDDAVVYLHASLVVTAGIYADEEVLFDAVTPQWQSYCRDTLLFVVPPGLVDTHARGA